MGATVDERGKGKCVEVGNDVKGDKLKHAAASVAGSGHGIKADSDNEAEADSDWEGVQVGEVNWNLESSLLTLIFFV